MASCGFWCPARGYANSSPKRLVQVSLSPAHFFGRSSRMTSFPICFAPLMAVLILARS